MKYLFALTASICIVFASAQGAFSYNTGAVFGWPIPYFPGSGIFMVRDFSGVPFNKVKIKVYNIDGEEVNSGMYPGYPAIWNGRDRNGRRVDPGVYHIKIEAEEVATGLHGTKEITILAGGGSRGSFTRGGWVGAKYVGMGRGGEVLADDVYSIYWNPAGLTELRHTQVLTEKEIREKAEKGKIDDITDSDLIKFSEEEKGFTIQTGLSGTMLNFGTSAGFWGMAVNMPRGVLGMGVYMIYTGGIDRRDYNGVKTGNLGYLGSAAYLSYGVSLGVSSFGFSLKGLYEHIGNNGFAGCGLDVGAQVYVLPFLKVGLMVQDLGTGMYPLDSRYNLRQRYLFSYPTLRLGIALITNRNFTLSLSGIKKLDEKQFGYGVGARYDILKWASVFVGFHNLVFSAGVTVHIIQFDASYSFTMDTITIGFNHNVSATVLF
jgi:hypothetical protein